MCVLVRIWTSASCDSFDYVDKISYHYGVFSYLILIIGRYYYGVHYHHRPNQFNHISLMPSLAILPLRLLVLDHPLYPLKRTETLNKGRCHPREPQPREQGHSMRPQSQKRQESRLQHMNPDHGWE